jgi:hypothetical protein
MKLRVSILASTIAVGIAVCSSPAYSQFGGLSLPGAKKAQPAGGIDPDGFLKTTRVAEGLMTKSLEQMSEVLATKEDIAKITALKKQADEATDPKEKEAIQQKIVASQSASLNQVNYDKLTSDEVQKMDSAKRQKLAGSSFNFLLAVLKDQELAGQSNGLISSLTGNPANLSKLGAVKDAASSVSTQLGVTSSLVGKMPKLFAAVGVKDVPKISDAPISVQGD